MNKIHKTVWSACKGEYVVVSENTKSKRVGCIANGSLTAFGRSLAGQFVFSVLSYSVLLAFAQPVLAKTMAEYNPAADRACFFDAQTTTVICGNDSTEVVTDDYRSFQNVVIGHNARVKYSGAIAVGNGAQAMSYGSIAIGENASAGHQNPFGTPQNPAGPANGIAKNIAIGFGAYAHGANNISIGERAGRESIDNVNYDNVNIGTYANFGALSANSIAIGKNAGALTGYNASGNRDLDQTLREKQLSVPVGSRNPNIYIGKDAGFLTASYGNIALGDRAAVGIDDIRVKNNIAVGTLAGWGMTTNNGTDLNAPSGSNIVIGNWAGYRLSGDGNLALGGNAGKDSTGDNNISLGNGAAESSNGTQNIAFGINARKSSTGNANIALGAGAAESSTGSENIAFGINAGRGSTGGYNIVFGTNAGKSSNGSGNIALGGRAAESITGAYNIALGDDAGKGSTGDDNIALGRRARRGATGAQNVVFGTNAGVGVTADRSIIIGPESGAAATNYSDSVLLGSRVNSESVPGPVERGVGIGRLAHVVGSDSIAIGTNARTGKPSRAGHPATSADSAIAIGRDAAASSEESIAIGGLSRATGIRSVSVGSSNQVLAEKAVVLGSYVAIAEDLIGAVALGSDSVVNAAVPTESVIVNGFIYGNFAGATPAAGDVVSVGNVVNPRQIQHVAAGQISTSSTDAVNGSQLFYVAKQVSDNTSDILAGVNLGDGSTSNKFALGDTINVTGDSNVLSTTSTDGVQLKLANTLNVGDTHPIAIDGTAGTIGGLTNTSFDPAATYQGGKAATQEQLQSAFNSVSGVAGRGWNLTANGADSTTVAPGGTVDFSSEGDDVVISKSDNNITVKLAEDLTATSVTTGNSVLNDSGLTITDGPSITNAGINAGSKKVTNVVAGDVSENSSDAVNGAQLHATNQTVAGNTAAIAGNTAAIAGNTASIAGNTAAIADNTAAIADNAAAITNNTNAITNLTESVGRGWNLTANGEDSSKVEAGDTIDFSADDDKIVVSKTGKNIRIGLAQDLAFSSVATGDTTLNDRGLTITDGPSVTKEGIAAGDKKITDIAAGDVAEDSTDAVTGGQLFETNQKVADNATAIADNKTAIAGNTAAIADNKTAIAGNTAAIADNKAAIADNTTAIAGNTNAITNINNELDKGFNFGDGSTANKFSLGDTINVKGDHNVLSTTSPDGVQLSLASDLTVDSLTAGNSTLNNDGLTIADGPSITSAGINAGDKKITNIAAGDLAADSKDVVTGGQLFETNQAVAANTASIADNAAAITNNTNAITNLTETVGRGWNLTANGEDSSKVEAGDTIDFSADDDKIVVSKTGNSIRIGLAQDLAFSSVSTGDTTLNDRGLTITDGPSVTKEGIAAGDKKITNVAAGDVAENSTDAVTGGQLFETNQKVADNATAIADNTTAIAGNTAAIADNKAAIADNTTAIAGNTNAITNINNELDKGFNFGDGSTANKFALGDTINVKGDHNVLSTTSPDGVQLSLANDLTVDSLTAGNSTLNNDGLTIADGPSFTSAGINAGDKKITNIAAGDLAADSKDVVTGGQLFETNQAVAANTAAITNNTNAITNLTETVGRGWNLTANGEDSSKVEAGDTIDFSAADDNIVVSKSGNDIKVGLARDLSLDSVAAGNTRINNDGLTIAGGPSVTSAGIDAAGNKVTNVAAGTDPTDAVNVAQLREVQNLASAGWNIGDANGPVGQLAPGAQVNFVAGNNNTRVTVTQDNGVSQVEVSAAPSPMRYIGTANARRSRRNAPADDPFTPTNEVALVGADPDTPVSLNNVAKAQLSLGSLQAVNGEQLFVLGDSVATSLGGGSVFNASTGRVEASLSVNGTTYNNVNDALSDIGAAAAAGWKLQVDDDTPTQVAPGSTVGFKAGNNVVLERDGNNITVSALPNATFTAVNAENVSARDVEVSQSIGVVDGPSLNREGINAAGTPIANVAPGTKGTDAVNVNQLRSGLSQLDGTIQRYKNDANGGTAAAMAMAGLPQAYLPGKSMFAIGGSTFQGQGGYAAGLSTVSENGKWVLKGTVAGSSRGQVGAAVGVGYQW